MSTAITSVIKIMESLPIEVQEQVLEHIQEYIEDLKDEMKWDKSFEKTQLKLVGEAKRVQEEIRKGIAIPLDSDDL